MEKIILYALLCVEILVLGFMLVKVFTQNKIADIKSTKYFIPTLFINLSIYLYAVLLSTTSNFFEIFFTTLESGIKACVLGVNTDLILPLVQSSTLFSAVFCLSYIISVFTFIYVFIALVGRSINNKLKCFLINLSKKDKVVIIGYNNDSLEFYKSLDKKTNVLFWVPTEDKEKIKQILGIQKLNIVFDKISKETFKKFSHSQTKFISFIESEASVLSLLDIFSKIKSDNFKIYISIDSNFENTFKNSFSAYNVNFFNKYSLISQKFIMDNPLTSLIDDKYIDNSTATIDKKLDLNIFLMGYGRTNKNLFSNLMIDNQFFTIDKNILKNKKVNYYLFDKREYMGDKDFSYNANRNFATKIKKENYYDIADVPLNMEFFSADINSKKFYNKLREIISSQDQTNTFNMIITSISSDLENIDQTMRLKQTFEEMGLKNNIFFTKLRDNAYLPILEKHSNVKGFGEYEILNYNTIVCDKLNQLSIDRYFQSCLKNDEILEKFESFNRIRSVKKQMAEVEKLKLTLWKDLDPIEKDYNKYRSINLRTKLNLIGLDTKGTEQITNKEFYKKYDLLKEIKEINRQKIYEFPYPNTQVPRNILARQEHLHTVAFLISKGYLPQTKKEILNLSLNDRFLNTKNRTSFLLSSYDALDKIFEDRLAKFKDDKNAKITLDIKKDFYQIMDDVPLHKYANYLIYKK